MTRVVPTLLGVTTFPEIVATPGRDEVKIHVPGEVEVGTFKLNEVTLSSGQIRSNLPIPSGTVFHWTNNR